jgi:DNA-binding LacI/PurR family transcriptional regulator
LDQVAARAGVGRGTVSRVVNGSSQVSAAARARVEAAIAELGYIPNRAARALVTQRTDVIAFVLSEPVQRTVSDTQLAELLRGCNAQLLGTPLQLWLALAAAVSQREQVARWLTPQHVDGVLLLSYLDPDPLVDLLAGRALPVVLAGLPIGPALGDESLIESNRSDALCRVAIDDAAGASSAVAHLIDRGCRWIGAIASAPPDPFDVSRLHGYRHGLAHAGLGLDGSWVEYATDGAAGMRALLGRHPQLDGVLATTSGLAGTARQALREAPARDITVIGFTDSVATTQPDLPVVHRPVAQMAAQMVQLLIGALRGAPLPAGPVLLPPVLVLGRSA